MDSNRLLYTVGLAAVTGMKGGEKVRAQGFSGCSWSLPFLPLKVCCASHLQGLSISFRFFFSCVSLCSLNV